jgi:type I restriction enzyme S subunit
LVINKLSARDGALAVSDLTGIVSPAYWVFVLDETRVVPRYAHYLLRSAPYQAEIGRRSKFMPPAQFDLPRDQLRTLRLHLPPLDEQRRIADFLDAETTRLDSLALPRARQLALLETREVSAISQILDDQAALRVRLGYLASLQSGVTVGGSRPMSGLVERPYLRVANVKEDRLELESVTSIWVTPQEARASRLRNGDVLMTEGGDLDKLGRGTVWRDEISNCLHQNHVFALRCGPRLLPEYLAYYTRAATARSYFALTGVKTTNLASTNSAKVRGLKIPLPSLPVQSERVSQVKTVLATGGELRRSLQRQEELVSERRQALITAAVTGLLDVTTARTGLS